jgi:hypothetical protein
VSGSTFDDATGILTIPEGEDDDGKIPELKINLYNETDAFKFYSKIADSNDLFGGSEKDKKRRLEFSKIIRRDARRRGGLSKSGQNPNAKGASQFNTSK